MLCDIISRSAMMSHIRARFFCSSGIMGIKDEDDKDDDDGSGDSVRVATAAAYTCPALTMSVTPR